MKRESDIQVLFCSDLDESIEFFCDQLGFRLDMIFPADQPRTALLSHQEVHVRLEVAGHIAASRDKVAETRIPSKPELNRAGDGSDWVDGRAGMRYKDLLPDRLGGSLIASQIHVSNPGPVADYVHFHEIHFQIIYCLNGWASLVYEDQGDPFRFAAGDCILQPPKIRHRVLETSGAFDVVEVSCPAEHKTFVEHKFELPNESLDKGRLFGNQKFIWSRADTATYSPGYGSGLLWRDTGIFDSSGGLVSVEIGSSNKESLGSVELETDQTSFVFVEQGSATVVFDGSSKQFEKEDSLLIPSGHQVFLDKISTDFRLLKVSVYKFQDLDPKTAE